MRLNEALITSFHYKGKEYNIDLAFDTVLDVFDVIQTNGLTDEQRADTCLSLLLSDEWEAQETIEMWNYVYKEFIYFEDEEPVIYDRKGNPVPRPKDEKKKKKFIDIEQDAEFIYASFLQAYNINLFKRQGAMHWHEFKALLNGLPRNTSMQKIIQIRLWEPSKHDSAKTKEEMRKLQKIYELKDEEVD